MIQTWLMGRRAAELIVLLAVALTGCQTDRTGYRSEKLVNLKDPFQCDESVYAETDHAILPFILKGDRVCIVFRDISYDKAQKIIDAAEIAYQKVVSFLNIEAPRKITIVIRTEAKKSTPRARSAYGRINIPQRYFRKGVNEIILVHEITHVLMGSSGPYVTDPDNENARFDTDDTQNLNTSSLVTEGLALYLQSKIVDIPPHLVQRMNFHNAAKNKLQTAPPDDLLQSLHENTQLFRAHGKSFGRKQVIGNYSIAGSFSKYLIDRKGLQKFVEVYRGRDFRSVYKKNLNQLQSGWLLFLENREGV